MDGHVICHSLSGYVRVRQEGSCFLVESFQWPNKWKKIIGIFNREKAIEFMEVCLIMDNAEKERRQRCNMGIQCPECSGVRINTLPNRFGTYSDDVFQCQECGCTYDRFYYLYDKIPA